MAQDREGFRDYRITHRVEVDPEVHGPGAAYQFTPGLPEVGGAWDEGELLDQWAFFTQEATVEQVGRTPDNKFFDITQVATNRPTRDCATNGGDNPLTFPDRVQIRSINYQKEGVYDQFGEPMRNSAFEQYRGSQVEFDAHRLQVYIEQNAASLELDLVQSLMHHLNDASMWGFAPRTIKLSEFSAEPKYYTTCQKYWLRRFTFDIADDFDRCLLDEGTKVLRGGWDRNPTSDTYGQYVIALDEDGPFGRVSAEDPKNFIRYKDWHGENTRVILNGRGIPWDPEGNTTGTADDNPGSNCFEYYPEGNHLLLGIPLAIDT